MRIKTEEIGRQVNVVSIGVSGRELTVSDLSAIIEKETPEGSDIVAVSELCLGFQIHPMDGEAVAEMCRLAAKKEVYIVFTIYRYGDTEDEVYNSSLLIDRKGKIVGIYDKAFPMWNEEYQDPPCIPGKDVPVFETDFGKIGMAICFDANYPEVFKRLSDLGAELVIWPSAFSGGMCMQTHAINHNYYIVTSTGAPDCTLYDISGQEVFCQTSIGIHVSKLSIDLDRSIFHVDMNIKKRDMLLQEHPDEVEMDLYLPKEGWFTLRAKKPGVSVKKLAAAYGIEELTPYKKRKGAEIDALRGGSVPG